MNIAPQLGLGLVVALALAFLTRARPREQELPTMTEARWSEPRKLNAAHPELRPKLVRILGQLRAEGWPAKLFYTYRSPTTQAGLVAAGTGARQSKHTATDAAGQPAARAADIVHATDGWEGPQAAPFFARLGELAEAEGLRWGGRWRNPYDPAHVELPGA